MDDRATDRLTALREQTRTREKDAATPSLATRLPNFIAIIGSDNLGVYNNQAYNKYSHNRRLCLLTHDEVAGVYQSCLEGVSQEKIQEQISALDLHYRSPEKPGRDLQTQMADYDYTLACVYAEGEFDSWYYRLEGRFKLATGIVADPAKTYPEVGPAIEQYVAQTMAACRQVLVEPADKNSAAWREYDQQIRSGAAVDASEFGMTPDIFDMIQHAHSRKSCHFVEEKKVDLMVDGDGRLFGITTETGTLGSNNQYIDYRGGKRAELDGQGHWNRQRFVAVALPTEQEIMALHGREQTPALAPELDLALSHEVGEHER